MIPNKDLTCDIGVLVELARVVQRHAIMASETFGSIEMEEEERKYIEENETDPNEVSILVDLFLEKLKGFDETYSQAYSETYSALKEMHLDGLDFLSSDDVKEILNEAVKIISFKTGNTEDLLSRHGYEVGEDMAQMEKVKNAFREANSEDDKYERSRRFADYETAVEDVIWRCTEDGFMKGYLLGRLNFRYIPGRDFPIHSPITLERLSRHYWTADKEREARTKDRSKSQAFLNRSDDAKDNQTDD